MPSAVSGLRKLSWIVLLCSLPLWSQQPVPDAPTPKTPPPGQFPEDAPPAPKNDHPEQPPQPNQPAPETASQPAPGTSSQPVPQSGNPAPAEQNAAQQAAAQPQPQGQEVVVGAAKLTVFRTNVNFVQIPVTVKDNEGHLVEGLTYQDFKVIEDGVPQQLRFFASDPLALSAAVVIDTDLPASTMKKVNESLGALIGAFSQFDEVALYRYGNTVQEISTYAGAANISKTTIEKVKREGRPGGPPPMGGPFGAGPTINGRPVDPGQPNPQYAPVPQESHVLNDAILRAAQDLSRRDRSRRRVIFVVSDGRELGSKARYDEVKRLLLTQNIAVYALGVDTAAVPIYDRLNRLRLPGFGYGDILPKYVSDTAGQMFAEFDRASIEQAYSRLTEVARNQYTVGYYAKATAASGFRTIDVRVLRPNLVVIAKQGYYPLPPERR